MAGLVLPFILLSCRYEVGGVWGRTRCGVESILFIFVVRVFCMGSCHVNIIVYFEREGRGKMDRERERPLFFICSAKMNEKCDIAPFLPFLLLRFDWTDSNLTVIVIIIIMHAHSLSFPFPLSLLIVQPQRTSTKCLWV